jgi:hypothetical protein
LLGLCICTLCFAQRDDATERRILDSQTDGQPNGRFWNYISADAKFGFVIGYCAAATGPLKCPTEAEFGEIEKATDRFYQDPENLRLPIAVSVQVFARRLEGMSEATIRIFLESARKQAASHPTK